jgi:hypothetical protein
VDGPGSKGLSSNATDYISSAKILALPHSISGLSYTYFESKYYVDREYSHDEFCSCKTPLLAATDRSLRDNITIEAKHHEN